jgi:hypothetical protein
MNTPSEVGGVLTQIADGLPWTPDAEGYQRLLTRAANHLLLSLILRVIYDMPSTVGGMHEAPSTLCPNDDTRTRFGSEKSMIQITASLREVRPLELSRQQLQPTARPGDGRGTMSTTPLPGTDIIIVDRRTHVEYRRSLHVSGPFSAPLISKSPTSISTSLSRTPEDGWLSTLPLPESLGQLKM